jgi:hypothetical protein
MEAIVIEWNTNKAQIITFSRLQIMVGFQESVLA